MLRGMIEHCTRDWVIRRRLSGEFAACADPRDTVGGSSVPVPVDGFGGHCLIRSGA